MPNKENQISPLSLYCLMGLMLIFGTCITLVTKAQDNVVVGTYYDEDKGKNVDKLFKHPYF